MGERITKNLSVKKNPFSGWIDRGALFFFRLTCGRLPEKLSKEQFEKNVQAWKKYRQRTGRHKEGNFRGRERYESLEDKPFFIENQWELTDFFYGQVGPFSRRLFFHGKQVSAADNSCEVIALYNALVALAVKKDQGSSVYDASQQLSDGVLEKKGHRAPDFPELLFHFSQKGICAQGAFGTSPRAIEKELLRRGFQVQSYTGRRITKESMCEAQKAEAWIFSAFNRGQNPFSMVHTMCITKERTGFQVHNDYAGSRIYPSLYRAVTGYNGGAGHPITVLAIRR